MSAAEPGRPPVVYVRYNSNAQFTVNVDDASSVASIKEAVAKHHGVDSSTLKIIFAGTELRDELTLTDCQVETQSILHAVSNVVLNALPSAGVPGLPSLRLDGRDGGGSGQSTEVPNSPTTPVLQAHFFVYCKDESCHGVATGKLRVRCSACLDGGFVLEKGPTCWEDVLEKARIRGRCTKSGCNNDVAEFYFKCARHPTDEKQTCVVLDLLQTNTERLPCITCTDNAMDVILVFPCDDEHIICLGCFNEYGTTKLNDRSFDPGPNGYTIPCPAPSCPNSFIKEVHHFRLLGDTQYERYQRFGTEDMILQEGGVLCPNPRCNGPIPLEGNIRRVRCPYCQHDFCKVCKEAVHQGPCAAAPASQPPPAAEARSRYTVSEENAHSAAMSQRIIRDISKQCPSCQVNIEKDGGCMHMTCARCRHQWCWMCGTPWSQNCQSNHWFGPR